MVLPTWVRVVVMGVPRLGECMPLRPVFVVQTRFVLDREGIDYIARFVAHAL